MFPFTVIVLYDFNSYMIIIIRVFALQITKSPWILFLFVSEHYKESFQNHTMAESRHSFMSHLLFFLGTQVDDISQTSLQFCVAVWLNFSHCKVSVSDVSYIQAWTIKTFYILFCMLLPIHLFHSDK